MKLSEDLLNEYKRLKEDQERFRLKEFEYFKSLRYRKFMQEDPKALITLLFMEKYHTIWDDNNPFNMVPIASPAPESVEELYANYEEGKTKNIHEMEDYMYEWDFRLPDCDDDIEKVYNEWKQRLTGSESIDEKIEILVECFTKITTKDSNGFCIDDLPF